MSRITLITGASRGLGFATAAALAAPSEHIIAVARTQGGLEELDDQIKEKGGTATLVPLDITDETGLQQMGKVIFDRWGHLDGLIHCAAHAVPLAPVALASVKDVDRAWAVNARATQRLIAMCEPLLRASNDGLAIHCHDPHIAGKFSGAYRASKDAALSLVGAWAQECKKPGPRVEVFEPNPMATALRGRFFPGEGRETLADLKSEAERLLELY